MRVCKFKITKGSMSPENSAKNWNAVVMARDIRRRDIEQVYCD